MTTQNQIKVSRDHREAVRPAPNPERHHIEDAVTKDDVCRLLSELDDVQIARILAWAPTLADLESAAVALAADYDELPLIRDALSGKAAAVFEIVCQEHQDSAASDL